MTDPKELPDDDAEQVPTEGELFEAGQEPAPSDGASGPGVSGERGPAASQGSGEQPAEAQPSNASSAPPRRGPPPLPPTSGPPPSSIAVPAAVAAAPAGTSGAVKLVGGMVLIGAVAGAVLVLVPKWDRLRAGNNTISISVNPPLSPPPAAPRIIEADPVVVPASSSPSTESSAAPADSAAVGGDGGGASPKRPQGQR